LKNTLKYLMITWIHQQPKRSWLTFQWRKFTLDYLKTKIGQIKAAVLLF
jgi:hypothetical protein